MQLKTIITVGHQDTISTTGYLGSLAGGVKASHVEDINETMTAYDDVSGEYLKPQEVLRARLKELQYIREKGVYKKISRQEAKKLGLGVVGTRWIDINKGDDMNPNHRSRFVAKENNNGKLQACLRPLLH